jgi:uncharacterized repeat protein (TIGR01451 family)
VELAVELIANISSNVIEAPLIGTQPQNVTVEQFRPFSLSVTPSQGVFLTYQWYLNDSPVNGGTSRFLSFNRADPTNNGSYYVVISNSVGVVTSVVATVTVLLDTNAPTIVSVGSLDGRFIGVCFSEELNTNSPAVTEPASYSINTSEIPLSVTIRPDGRSVKLEMTSPISGSFTVDTFDIPDLAGNTTVSSGGNVVMGFAAHDVGNPGQAGSHFTCDSDTVEVVGGGNDVWNNTDQFYLASKTITGAFDIKVRVTALRGSNTITKAVIVARESTNADSRAFHVSVNPLPPGRDLAQMGLRAGTSNVTAAVGTNVSPSGIPNAWLRIRRVGDTFTGYHSANGSNWVQIGQTNQSFPSGMVIGFGITAHDNAIKATGSFSSFSVDRSFADLGITGTDSPDPVSLGANVTYSLSVTNKGFADAPGTLLSNTLPAGATFVSANSSQGSCSNAGGGIIVCDLGTIATNGSASVTIVVTPTSIGSATNRASVTTTGAEGSPGDNSATFVTLVQAPPQESIVQASYAGGNFSAAIPTQNGVTYAVQYKNDLNTVSWSTLATFTGDGTVKTFTDTNPGVPMRFYRIIIP